MKELKLSNGVKIPAIGFGVFQTRPGEEAVNAVKTAISCGYTHIDTAMYYQNEKDVAAGIKESKSDREDIFITTKLWNDDIRSGKLWKHSTKVLKS